MKALLDNQTKAYEKLRTYKVGALFMEPGTGKTLTALELVRSVAEIDYLLWLCPFQTKLNLLDEIDSCGGYIGIDIQGIESLSNSDRLYLEITERLQSAQKPFIVCDESLKIKNSDAKRTQRIIELGKFAKYKLVLNGTPVSRNLLDVWAQMEFLSPKILKMRLAEFKNTFVEYIKITKHLGHKRWSKEFIKSYHNVDYLYSLIGPFVFDAKLELDRNKQYIDIAYKVSSEELAEHNKIKELYLDNEAMQAMNNNIFLEITQKMQHNYSCSAEKFEIVSEILRTNKPNTVLIYAKYIDTQERLRKQFPDAKVLSWQKHAFGLNLQSYNRIIFFDKVWDYALRDQAEHRVFRIGQDSDVIFYDLTGNVGLENLINKNISKKHRLLDYFKSKSITELMKEL